MAQTNIPSRDQWNAALAKYEPFDFMRLLVVIVCLLIGLYLLPASWTDRPWYAYKYSINEARIHRRDRPTDCDFMHAPLGDKGCRYKKMVTAYNANGDTVMGDNAPRYGKNTDGNPIVSNDDGKTWQLLDTLLPDLTVKTLEIDWVKVTD